ncbi:MAG: chemotaxis protein CheA [Nitrospinae bacterium]|nr:chemotaxis protein CheA [Nitrospinota bacterium]
MTTNGLREILETLDEISSGAEFLTPELKDKKTISDVMLALEKIVPMLRGNAAPKAVRLIEALSLLFEKFLMESVDDGGPGLECAKAGVVIIRASLTGDGVPAQLDQEADLLAERLEKIYGVSLPPAPPVATPAPSVTEPVESSVPEPASREEEDDFFNGLDIKREEKNFPIEDETPQESKDPLIEKLNRLAGEVILLEPDLGDKKAVADILLAFEDMGTSLRNSGKNERFGQMAMRIAAMYEKSLMEGLDRNQEAAELTSQGIKTLTSALEGREEESESSRKAAELIIRIDALLGNALPEPFAPASSPKPQSHAAAHPSPPPSQVTQKAASKDLSAKDAGVDLVKVATEEDLLLYTEFVSEAQETLANVEGDLLELEENSSSMELINNLFRAIHSLKGAAGFLGISTVNVLCHETETVMDKLRKKTAKLTQEMMDIFLKVVDVLKLVNDGLNASCQKAKTSMPDATLEIPKKNIEALVGRLSSLGQPKADLLPEEKIQEEEQEGKLGQILVNKQVISSDQLDVALKTQKHLGEILVDMGAVDTGTLGEVLKEQEEKRKKVVVTSLKVDTEKLDSLMDLVGELVITQSIVAHDKTLQTELNKNLFKNVSSLGKITKNIQDQVMSLRMVQLKQTFQKMSRLTRDLSKKMKKQMIFHISGDETEIDKTIIEELNDPLVHIIRNAMDHGVETPENRVAQGKNPVGNVWLSAYHKGGNVYIEVKDDGKGLDKERILKKAVEKNLLAPGAEPSEAEIFNLVFLPGFSTAAKITDVSGRGVGMDVVKSNIDRLGGKVEISSKPGLGSTFTIKLPLTMAIVDGMIVKIGAERFIIPTVSIRESIRPKAEEVSTVKRQGEMMNIRGRLLPLIRLHQVLKVRNAAIDNPCNGLVIIVESDEKVYGLMVDDLLGQQQVVIKNLGKRFKGLPGISGGTILGDGRVGLILDVSGVVAMN